MNQHEEKDIDVMLDNWAVWYIASEGRSSLNPWDSMTARLFKGVTGRSGVPSSNVPVHYLDDNQLTSRVKFTDSVVYHLPVLNRNAIACKYTVTGLRTEQERWEYFREKCGASKSMFYRCISEVKYTMWGLRNPRMIRVA
jgi:predicted DNA-binding transcriptional regulator AlpA